MAYHVLGSLPDAFPDAEELPDLWKHWSLLHDVEIRPDALRRLQQAAGETMPFSHTSSSALETPPEDLESAIIRYRKKSPFSSEDVAHADPGLLELPGRRLLPVAIWPYSSGKPLPIWAMLNHPSILPVLGHGAGSLVTPYCNTVLEHCAGSLLTPDWDTDVGSYLESHPELDKHLLITQVAEGLEYLHIEMGIVHGNLKPGAVCINAHGNAMIAVFELSTSVFKSPLGTRAATSTPETDRYAAPEILFSASVDAPGRRLKSTESDIYAFGMLVYEILSGRRPWHSKSDIQVILDVAKGHPPARPEEGQMNDFMWNLCVACWDRRPARRPGIADIVAGLRSPAPPTRWQDTTVGGSDPADPSPDQRDESPAEEVPESTLRIVLHGADVEIFLPAQTPMKGGFGQVLKGYAMIHGGDRELAVKKCLTHKVQPREYSIWKSLSHKYGKDCGDLIQLV